MKKKMIPIIMLSSLVLLFSSQDGISQEKKTSTVKITITEDEKVTTDTTFELVEGQDPEMIKKMVSHLAGGDIHTKHMSQDVHVSHSGDKKMVWISSDDDDDKMHEHMMMSDFNIDSIKEAHPDAKVLVIKDKNGEVTVKEVDDEHGEHHKMIKEHKVTIVSDEEGDGTEKEVEVFVTAHDDHDHVWIEKGKADGDENVEVYVIKTGDSEDVKVMKKKIKVKIEEEHEGVEVEKTKKKKK